LTYLNNDMRAAIVRRAQAHAFDARKEAMAVAEDALAREVHAALFKKGWLDIAEKLPPRWVARTRVLRVNAHGEKIELAMRSEGDPVIVPALDRDNTAWVNHHHIHGSFTDDGTDDCMARRIATHARERDKLKNERAQAGKTLRTMLDTFRTVKAMHDAWPEGEPFYRDYKLQRRQVPVVQVGKINDLFDLPVAEDTPA